MTAWALLAAEAADIVVTGRPLAGVPGEAAYAIVEIAQERLAGQRLEAALAEVAGFQSFRRVDSSGANPTSQGATLRALGGNASSRALVLLDGVPVADPFAGFIPYATLRPERLARVRVTRGGGAGAFGAGAVAGTIELDSGGPDDLPALALDLAGGSYGASRVQAGGTTRLGTGFAALHVGWDRADGYFLVPAAQRGPVDIRAPHDAISGALRAVVPWGGTEVQASLLAFDDRRLRGQAGTASSSRGADASLRLVGRGRWGWEALAYLQLRSFTSGFVATSADRATATPSLDQFNTPALGAGAKIELRPPLAGHALRIGLDLRHAEGATNERFRYQGGGFTRLRRAGGSSLSVGAFVEDSLTVGALTLTGGARIDRWSLGTGELTERAAGDGALTASLTVSARQGWETTARGGVAWRVGRALTLRGAGYGGFRLPTLNELYRPFRVGADATAANPALAPERLAGVEAGARWQRDRLRVDLTLYANRLSGAIGNVTLGRGPGVFPQVGFVAAGGVFRERRNLDAIEVLGAELDAQWHSGPWRLSGSVALADATVRASGVAAALDGKRPAQSPRIAGSLRAAWRDALGVTLRYQGAQPEDDLNQRQLPDALTLDFDAAVLLAPGLSLYGRVENALDAQVVSGISASGIIDIAQPRAVWIGVRLTR